MNTVIIEQNYGPIKKGEEYVVLEKGYDFVRIRHHGKGFNVPNWAVNTPQYLRRRKQRENLPTYEEIIEAEI